MSRRKKGRDPSANQPRIPAPSAPEARDQKTDELKWTRREAHIALAVAITSGVAWWWERRWPSSRNFRPILTAVASETLLSDSRLLSIFITNNGSDPAGSVVVTIESNKPFVKLDEETRRDHMHVIPPRKFDVNVEDRKVVLTLEGKIGAGQNVLIYLDRLGPYPDKPGLFQCSVAYNQGLAEMTKNVTPLYGVSSADYIKASGGDIQDAIEGSK